MLAELNAFAAVCAVTAAHVSTLAVTEPDVGEVLRIRCAPSATRLDRHGQDQPRLCPLHHQSPFRLLRDPAASQTDVALRGALQEL